jgi:uncharacterized protein with FMN-binding domain
MKRPVIRPAVPALLFAAGLALPAGGALAASSSTAHTYKGPVEEMRWGPVQVSITVKNRKIVKVKAMTAPDSFRSEFIQGQAIPLLRQETLQAQSANIDEISGATDISDAYAASLQGAIKAAKKHKALK